MLTRLASRWGLQEADAKEVVQETLLGVAKSIERFQPDGGGSFRRWLATITRNKMADLLASRSFKERASGNSDVQYWLNQQASEDSQASVWDFNQRRQVFAFAAQKVRGQVNEQTWQAFHRTAVLNEDVKQVAIDLQMREGMVYVARSRVMSRLRKTVQLWSIADEGDTA